MRLQQKIAYIKGQWFDRKVKEMAELKEMHKNAASRFGMTLAIIMPVGVVVTLNSAAARRRKEFLPA